MLSLADDCQPCMCPGNVVAKDVNVFATTCESAPAEQTGPLCHNCPVGHTGNRCQICQAGYYGVPEDPQVCSFGCLFIFMHIWTALINISYQLV